MWQKLLHFFACFGIYICKYVCVGEWERKKTRLRHEKSWALFCDLRDPQHDPWMWACCCGNWRQEEEKKNKIRPGRLTACCKEAEGTRCKQQGVHAFGCLVKSRRRAGLTTTFACLRSPARVGYWASLGAFLFSSPPSPMWISLRGHRGVCTQTGSQCDNVWQIPPGHRDVGVGLWWLWPCVQAHHPRLPALWRTGSYLHWWLACGRDEFTRINLIL